MKNTIITVAAALLSIAAAAQPKLTKVLRDEWGFDGIVMTDWGLKDGTVQAVIAGNDLMEPGNQTEIDRIVAAVKDGSLPMADLDRNVKRILEYIVKTPSFQSISGYYEKYVEYNDALLALRGTERTTRYGISHFDDPAVSREAIDLHAKNNDVAIVVLGRISGEGSDRHMDDDFNLTAIERQLLSDVHAAYHGLGKKVIVVLNIGGVIETASWRGMADAIVLPWLPGQEGANAVADVITGKVNPSGKLPMTFPLDFLDHPSSADFPYTYVSDGTPFGVARAASNQKDVDYTEYNEGIWVGYRHFATRGVEVAYPFGYGLSYTSFEYSAPALKVEKDGSFTATISVKNVGKTAGKESVQLYVNAPAGGLEKPSMELKSFAKTSLLAPGESQTLSFKVSAYELASFNETLSQWETAAGTYTVHFAASAQDIRHSLKFKLAKPQSFAVTAGACL